MVALTSLHWLHLTQPDNLGGDTVPIILPGTLRLLGFLQRSLNIPEVQIAWTRTEEAAR